MNILPILILAGVGAYGLSAGAKKKKSKRKQSEPFSYTQPTFGLDDQGNTVVVFDTEWLTLEAEPFLRGWAEVAGLASLAPIYSEDGSVTLWTQPGMGKVYDDQIPALGALLTEHAPDIKMVLDAPPGFDNPGAIQAANLFAGDLKLSIIRSALLTLGFIGPAKATRPDASAQSFVLTWSTLENPVVPKVVFGGEGNTVISGASHFFVTIGVSLFRELAIANGLSPSADDAALGEWFGANVDFFNDPPLLTATLNEGAAAVPVLIEDNVDDATLIAALSTIGRNTDAGIQIVPAQLSDFEKGDADWMGLVSVDSPVMAVALQSGEPLDILLSFNVASGKLRPVESNVRLVR